MGSIQRLNPLDIRNAISSIKSKQDALLEAVEKHENTGSVHTEMRMVVAASDCEIEMSNFANYLRSTLTAGVIN